MNIKFQLLKYILLVPIFINISYSAALKFNGPLNFGKVEVGESKSLQVKIKNTSKKRIRLDSYWFEKSTNFSYEKGTCKFLGAGLRSKKSCTFEIIFKPTIAKEVKTQFTVGYYKRSSWRWNQEILNLTGVAIEKGSGEEPPSQDEKVRIDFNSNHNFEVKSGEFLNFEVKISNDTYDKIRIDEYWFTHLPENFQIISTNCKDNLLQKSFCFYKVGYKATDVGSLTHSFTLGYYPGTSWDWLSISLPLKINVIKSEVAPPPQTFPAEGRLHVEGNKILDALGRQVILKGVNIADPEHLNVKTHERPGVSAESIVLMAVQDYYAKVVRLPILPGHKKYPNEGWFSKRNGGQKYLENHIDPLVQMLTSKNIYVIIDLHYVSDFNGLFPKVSEFWKFMAPVYKDNPYVIYEIFNEPIRPDNWDRFKSEIAAPTVKIIRKAAPDNLIIVGSPYWSSHLQGIADNPIESTNIIYTAHVYSNQSPSVWEKNYSDVIKKYPVFVTEWGFETGGVEGGNIDFGKSFEKWMNLHKLSWTAWCFDSLWGPRMFDEDWKLKGGRGGMGDFVKEKLIENNQKK